MDQTPPDRVRPDALAQTREGGLDLLRVLAISLVFLHHYFSVLQRDAYTSYAGLDIGQLGVAIFLAISGYLAGIDRRAPTAWLFHRLVRVFPAYWIAVLASVAGVLAVNYKPISVGSVVSQFLGTAGFTHPDQLANVATWFISLLLACYLVGFWLRWMRAASWVYGVVAIGLLAAPLLGVPSLLLLHAATFFTGMIVSGRSASTHLSGIGLIMLGIVLAVWANLETLYVSLSIGLLLGGLQVRRSAAAAKWTATGSYEFYLVHGPILVATAMLLGNRPLLVLVAAVAAGVLAAFLLQKVAKPVEMMLRRATVGNRLSPRDSLPPA